MLVITRKRMEQIVAASPGSDDKLIITVVEIRGDKVRLGLESGRAWSVHRKEVWDQIYGGEPPRGIS